MFVEEVARNSPEEDEMRRSWATLAVAMSLITISAAATKPAIAKQEIWYLNGHEVRWNSYGGLRQVIKFRSPRRGGAHAIGRYGKVVFRGWRMGRRLVGRARTFRRGCRRPFRYKVRGWISPDGRRAVLQGPKPVIVDCRIVGYSALDRGSIIVLTRRTGDGFAGYEAF